jgi:hypothetical protein
MSGRVLATVSGDPPRSSITLTSSTPGTARATCWHTCPTRTSNDEDLEAILLGEKPGEGIHRTGDFVENLRPPRQIPFPGLVWAPGHGQLTLSPSVRGAR